MHDSKVGASFSREPPFASNRRASVVAAHLGTWAQAFLKRACSTRADISLGGEQGRGEVMEVNVA